MFGYLMDAIRVWRMNYPEIPPFAALVVLFITVNLVLFYATKSRGYLITMLAGALYLIPMYLL